MGIAVVNYHLGYSALTRGEYDAAATLCAKALDAWSDCGYVQGENWAQYNLAFADMGRGRRPSAMRRYLDCLRSAHRYGFRRELCNVLDRLGDAIADRDPELALRCIAYAGGREQSGYVVLRTDRDAYDVCLRRLRERLSPDTFASQWNLGVASEEDELISLLSKLIGSEL